AESVIADRLRDPVEVHGLHVVIGDLLDQLEARTKVPFLIDESVPPEMRATLRSLEAPLRVFDKSKLRADTVLMNALHSQGLDYVIAADHVKLVSLESKAVLTGWADQPKIEARERIEPGVNDWSSTRFQALRATRYVTASYRAVSLVDAVRDAAGRVDR